MIFSLLFVKSFVKKKTALCSQFEWHRWVVFLRPAKVENFDNAIQCFGEKNGILLESSKKSLQRLISWPFVRTFPERVLRVYIVSNNWLFPTSAKVVACRQRSAKAGIKEWLIVRSPGAPSLLNHDLKYHTTEPKAETNFVLLKWSRYSSFSNISTCWFSLASSIVWCF